MKNQATEVINQRAKQVGLVEDIIYNLFGSFIVLIAAGITYVEITRLSLGRSEIDTLDTIVFIGILATIFGWHVYVNLYNVSKHWLWVIPFTVLTLVVYFLIYFISNIIGFTLLRIIGESVANNRNWLLINGISISLPFIVVVAYLAGRAFANTPKTIEEIVTIIKLPDVSTLKNMQLTEFGVLLKSGIYTAEELEAKENKIKKDYNATIYNYIAKKLVTSTEYQTLKHLLNKRMISKEEFENKKAKLHTMFKERLISAGKL